MKVEIFSDISCILKGYDLYLNQKTRQLNRGYASVSGLINKNFFLLNRFT